MKKICLWVSIVIAIVAIVFVGVGLIKKETYHPQNPVATVFIEGYEKPIKIELKPTSAPNAVANFVKLANNGFYNNFKLHIDEKEIVGDKSMEKARLSNIMEYPQNDYMYGIKGDILANDYDNLVQHKKGTITMKRDDYSYFGYAEEGYNSANCNFAILTEDNDTYNGYYAGFGDVIEGMDVLDAISATRVEEKTETTEAPEGEATPETAEATEPVENNTNIIVIKSITVDTFGVDYGMPEYVNYEENLNKVNQICMQYFGQDYASVFGN